MEQQKKTPAYKVETKYPDTPVVEVIDNRKTVKTNLGLKIMAPSKSVVNEKQFNKDINENVLNYKSENENLNVLIENIIEKNKRLKTSPNYELSNDTKKDCGKYALVTILDNVFAEYYNVFINSFLENNIWFNGDIVILFSENLSPLSDIKRAEISFFYKKTIFKKIDDKVYDDVIKSFKAKISKNFHRFIPSILTIESFNLTEYEKVLYLDSDMLVIGDIKNLFSLKNKIIATRDTSVYTTDNYIKNINDTTILLNGGFLLLDGDFIKSEPHVLNMINLFHEIETPKFLDQTLLNEYLKKYEVLFVSSDYNLLKRCFDDSKQEEFKKAIDDIKIIHYVGEKPWNEKKKEFEKNYTNIESLWNNYFDRYKYVTKKIDAVNLISSGINTKNLIKILPEIKENCTVTTNWGFKYHDLIDIDYYYCTTTEDELIDEIILEKFDANKLWLITDNVKSMFSAKGLKHLNAINPFKLMSFRSEEYYNVVEKRKQNLSLPLPTSGIGMLFLFSLMDVKKINIIGYNLYTKINTDSSFKEYGISKYINPYNQEDKPHTLEFDLNMAILSLKNYIKNGIVINFYDSDIIEEIYNLLMKKNNNGDIISQIKLKYYGKH